LAINRYCTPVAQNSLWRELYLQAIFEPEQTKLLVRIQEAERALLRREREIAADPNGSKERGAIINALHCLQFLRHCSTTSSRGIAS
jgi:hypothetical protein